MRNASLLLPVAALFALAACATTRMGDEQKLALYQGQAGDPVRSFRYVEPIGWDRVDSSHLVLDVRPRESYLLTMSGPCLDWGRGDATISIKHSGDVVSAGLDSVEFPGRPVSCRISEIRPVDPAAVRAARNALANAP